MKNFWKNFSALILVTAMIVVLSLISTKVFSQFKQLPGLPELYQSGNVTIVIPTNKDYSQFSEFMPNPNPEPDLDYPFLQDDDLLFTYFKNEGVNYLNGFGRWWISNDQEYRMSQMISYAVENDPSAPDVLTGALPFEPLYLGVVKGDQLFELNYTKVLVNIGKVIIENGDTTGYKHYVEYPELTYLPLSLTYVYGLTLGDPINQLDPVPYIPYWYAQCPVWNDQTEFEVPAPVVGQYISLRNCIPQQAVSYNLSVYDGTGEIVNRQFHGKNYQVTFEDRQKGYFEIEATAEPRRDCVSDDLIRRFKFIWQVDQLEPVVPDLTEAVFSIIMRTFTELYKKDGKIHFKLKDNATLPVVNVYARYVVKPWPPGMYSESVPIGQYSGKNVEFEFQPRDLTQYMSARLVLRTVFHDMERSFDMKYIPDYVEPEPEPEPQITVTGAEELPPVIWGEDDYTAIGASNDKIMVCNKTDQLIQFTVRYGDRNLTTRGLRAGEANTFSIRYWEYRYVGKTLDFVYMFPRVDKTERMYEFTTN